MERFPKALPKHSPGRASSRKPFRTRPSYAAAKGSRRLNCAAWHWKKARVNSIAQKRSAASAWDVARVALRGHAAAEIVSAAIGAPLEHHRAVRGQAPHKTSFHLDPKCSDMSSVTRTDVIVVGGGIMGAATAFFLRKRGIAVTLIERGLIGQQASGDQFRQRAPARPLSSAIAACQPFARDLGKAQRIARRGRGIPAVGSSAPCLQ